MTTTALRKQLYKIIEKVDDNELLLAVQAILNKSIEKQEEFVPLSLEAFYARNAQSQKEIKAGTLISHKEVKKKFRLK